MPTTARRPQPSTSEAELAARLRLAVSRLARRLRRESVSDITASQLSALYTIARLGPLTLGDLSSAEGVRPPTMTRVVASLEQLGLATRTVDPADRRVAHVAVTGQGEALVEASRHRKDAFLAARLRALGPEERALLERAAELLECLAAPE